MARRPVWIAWLLLFCLAGCGGSAPVYRVHAEQIILAFGDSLTNGYGAVSGQSYPEQLVALTGWTVIKSAVNGETSAQGRDRLPEELRRTRPDVVLLCLGGNDFLRRLDATVTVENLRAMLQMIRAAGAQPILLAVPEPTLLALSDHELYAALAREEGVPLIADVVSNTLKKSAWRSDRFHPNAQGYAHMAQQVAAALGYRD